MTMRNFSLIHILLFIVVAIFSKDPWPFLMLTAAQLVYVPIILKLVMVKGDWFSRYYMYFAVPAYIAVALLQITSSKWDVLLAAVYLLFTCVIATYGFSRFLKRGFTKFEEFAIDIGLIYLALGGAWFFAYETGINTGFTPLITWLTGIHFHYSAFLLPVFIGFLGRRRLYTSKLYKIFTVILLLSPMVVAIGITFSRWVELLSVLMYIVGIYGVIYLTIKTPFKRKIQKWLVGISFAALGVTIVFSLLYALGNGFGLTSITIDFMLRFHGTLNCVVFSVAGIIGWALSTPRSTFYLPTFPVSTIKGKAIVEDKSEYRGLVDQMTVYEPYIDCSTLPSNVIDLYENTIDYRLFATVKWHAWFKPFAYIYTFISRKTEQINLPFHSKSVEMTGGIDSLLDNRDGRDNVRVWTRKVAGETAFVALYSSHSSNERTYMNIALPLPFSSMIGILELNQIGDSLQLTSKKISSPQSDAGIYLATPVSRLFALPIEEDFVVRERDDGSLIAQHKMWIFSIPFLSINYSIYHRTQD